MAEYADLSEYSYSTWPEKAVNVGWLGKSEGYAAGEIGSAAWNALLVLAGSPQNLMRGMHDCELCDQESPIELASSRSARGVVWLGSGEIHVRGTGGRLLIAPTLILHYISDHGYQPPAEFVDGLLHR